MTNLEATSLARRLILALKIRMQDYCAGDLWDTTMCEVLTETTAQFLMVHFGDSDDQS